MGSSYDEGETGGGGGIHTLASHSTPYNLDADVSFDNDLILEETTHANEDGILYKDTLPFFHDFNYGNNGTVTTDGHNIFIGGAGNFTMGLTATNVAHSSYNIGIGMNALHSLEAGYDNIAIGLEALRDGTTCQDNVAIGNTAMPNCIAGDNNVAVGCNALATLTSNDSSVAVGYGALFNTYTGSNVGVGCRASYNNNSGVGNVAIGYDALYSNVNGGHNIVLGSSAARYISGGGDCTSLNDSVCIGYESKPGANGATNEITIGYQTEGDGDNTTHIGNVSTTKTSLEGVLNIGVTTDYANNAAAIAGGLVTGDVYRNGDVLMVVH